MQKPYRVQWQETRPAGDGKRVNYSVIAERYGHGWRFYEREVLEIRWFPLQSSDELCRLAESHAQDSAGLGRKVQNATPLVAESSALERPRKDLAHPHQYFRSQGYNPMQSHQLALGNRRNDYRNRGNR